MRGYVSKSRREYVTPVKTPLIFTDSCRRFIAQKADGERISAPERGRDSGP